MRRVMFALSLFHLAGLGLAEDWLVAVRLLSRLWSCCAPYCVCLFLQHERGFVRCPACMVVLVHCLLVVFFAAVFRYCPLGRLLGGFQLLHWFWLVALLVVARPFGFLN